MEILIVNSLKEADLLLSNVSVSGDSVYLLAQARQKLKTAFDLTQKLTKEEKADEV